MANSVRFTESQMAEILSKNKSVKISSRTPQKEEDKIIQDFFKPPEQEQLKKELSPTLKTQKNVIKKIISDIKCADLKSTYDDKNFALVFLNTRLLTSNQILALLQYKRKHEVFNYKKELHQKIQYFLSLQKGLPLFNCPIELTLYRQAPTFVDEDSVSLMFKYIIDALKAGHKKGYIGVLADDNRNIIKRIILKQQKGDYCVGIKIRDISLEYQEENFTLTDILNLN